jgi:hypothetical protein
VAPAENNRQPLYLRAFFDFCPVGYTLSPLTIVSPATTARMMMGPGNRSADREVDQFGLPRGWRREEVWPDFFNSDPKAWRVFEDWCASQDLRPFPATVETALCFLLSGSIEGPALYRTWTAIDLRHAAVYWHVDANPVALLGLQKVSLTPDGEFTIPPEVLARYGVAGS